MPTRPDVRVKSDGVGGAKIAGWVLLSVLSAWVLVGCGGSGPPAHDAVDLQVDVRPARATHRVARGKRVPLRGEEPPLFTAQG